MASLPPSSAEELTSPNKKPRKDVQAQPPIPEGWDRCHMFLLPKQRYCRQHPVLLRASSPTVGDALSHEIDLSTMYCGNHLCMVRQVDGAGEGFSRKRIPCPVDPTHSVYENQLTKHLKKCPATKQANLQRASYYFSQNINKGGHGLLTRETAKSGLEWAQQLALRVLQVHQQVFANDAICDPKQVSLSDIQSAIRTSDLSANEYENGIEQALEDYHVRSGGPKHVHQQASLVGHLRQRGAFGSSQQRQQEERQGSTTLLEVGAGRGMAGLVAAGVAAAATATGDSQSHRTKLIMVERNGARSKADTVLRKASALKVTDKSYINLDNIDYARIHCDISHVDVQKIVEREQLPHCKLVVLAKHLCGVGTDLALKSIEPVKGQVSACIMATCCHGACNWEDYVGREYLCVVMDDPSRNFVFGSSEFDMLRLWSGGSVHKETVASGTEDHDEINTHSTIMSSDADALGSKTFGVTRLVESLGLKCGQQGLGRACQRLIDFGRLGYLRTVLFPGSAKPGELLYYVSDEITPQNATLLASNF